MPLLLQALVSCTRLTWLQVARSLCCDGMSGSKPNVSWTALLLCMLLCGGQCNLCTGRLSVTAASILCISSDRWTDGETVRVMHAFLTYESSRFASVCQLSMIIGNWRHAPESAGGIARVDSAEPGGYGVGGCLRQAGS